jgi:hypothetical protein
VIPLLGVILGFVLPGCLLARLLRLSLGPVAGLLCSLMLLIQTVFWLGLCGLPLNLHTVGTVLLLATVLLAALLRRSPCPRGTRPPLSLLNKWVIAISAIVSALVMLRLGLAPLSGADTYWRWEFLATQILQQQSFAFYPPFDAADYSLYFYPEGVPPMVGFSYFWLYACFDGAVKSATSLLVGAQWAAILATTWAIARRLASARAGALAVAVLLSCQNVFWAVAIGQETGWTTLGMLAMIYFLCAQGKQRRAQVAMAAIAAATAALSREYGCYVAICGVCMLACQRADRRDFAIFATVVACLAAPWYLRTWMITGNPLYSLDLAGLFPRNLMYKVDMDLLGTYVGFQSAPGPMCLFFLVAFVQYATLPVLGLAASIAIARRHGFLLICAAFGSIIWFMSVRYTDVPSNSERVMAPVFAVLAIAAAIWFDQAFQRRRVGVLAGLFLVLGAFAIFAMLDAGKVQLTQWPQLVAAVLALAALGLGLDWRAPRRLVQLLLVLALVGLCGRAVCYICAFPTRHLKEDFSVTSTHSFAPRETRVRAFLETNPLPPGSRILATTTYAKPAFANSAYEIVSPFSPEMLFLLESEDPATVNAEFDARGIAAILVLDNPSVCRVPSICSKPAEGWTMVFDHWPNRIYLRSK